MSKERNQFIESDGLYWESETHEWFHDKISTAYARKKTVTATGELDDALNVVCLVTRNKETGEYDRVMMDVLTNEIIYDTKVLEDMAFQVDKMKLAKRFKNE